MLSWQKWRHKTIKRKEIRDEASVLEKMNMKNIVMQRFTYTIQLTCELGESIFPVPPPLLLACWKNEKCGVVWLRNALALSWLHWSGKVISSDGHRNKARNSFNDKTFLFLIHFLMNVFRRYASFNLLRGKKNKRFYFNFLPKIKSAHVPQMFPCSPKCSPDNISGTWEQGFCSPNIFREHGNKFTVPQTCLRNMGTKFLFLKWFSGTIWGTCSPNNGVFPK